MDLCDNLKETARFIIEDLTYVSKALRGVGVAIFYDGLVINGKLSLESKVSDKISNAEKVN